MSFIQNFFTSRDNQLVEVDDQTGNIGNTFVGQTSRLWYNPDDNSIYVSDGSTPGGILVAGAGGGNPFDQNLNTYNSVEFANLTISNTVDLGNLTIYDQTISGTINNRDVTVATVGTANISIIGGLKVHSSGNAELTPEFAVATDGQTTIRVPVVDVTLGAVEIIGSTSGAVVPLGNPGGMLHVTGQNNEASRIYNDGVNNYPLYVGRRYNGTAAAPTGVLAGQTISRLGANPYLTDTAAFAPLGTARIDFVATEDQTSTAQGTRIVMNVTPTGSTTQSTVALFDTSGILLTGNLIPFTNDTYTVGNSTNKWANVWIGPNSLYLEDSVLGGDAEVHVDNGVFYIDGVTATQVGNMQMTTNGLRLTTAGSGENIQVGEDADTGYMEVNMVGIEFKDGTRQTTAAIPISYLAAANGVATLGADSKVIPSQLPAGAVFFKGTWNANTNTPTLADGVGTAGWEYQVDVAGTTNFGSGPIAFSVGDFVIYNGTLWQRIPGSGAGVTSFNGRTGVVSLTSNDVTNALSNGSITNNFLDTDSWQLTLGQGIGLTGNATVELGDTITLTNTGVTAAIGGTGVAVSAATGNVTFSIGQAVGTSNSVQFNSITSSTTIQATGNITGGNIATGGRIVATGNVIAANFITAAGTLLNNGLDTTGNIRGGNLAITGAGTIGTSLGVTGNITGGNLTVPGQSNLGNIGNVHITGGNPGDSIRTDGAGNLSWVAPSGNVNIYTAANTTANIDFTFDSTTLIYLPTGPVTLNLSNYAAGHTARVIVRFGPTPYVINTGVANVAQSTEGVITIPISGAGGHNLDGNASCQLLYTCFDDTAGNCYVAATFL